MLYIITNLNDPWIHLLKDDPVRPSIPTQSRIHDHAEVFVLIEDNQPRAVTCVAYVNTVPKTESELGEPGNTVAVFYSIWSYAPGAGRELIQQAQQWIQTNWPTVSRYVTLSPKTEMARRFHLRNGALTLQENAETMNYEYRPA